MTIRARAFGTTAGHDLQGPRPVTTYELTDPGSGLRAEVLDYGAHLGQVHACDRSGRIEPICLVPTDLAGYEDRRRNPYLGALVGRYANRIGHARFSIDGEEHHVDANDGRNHIHGGDFGFDRFVWERVDTPGAGEAAVAFRLERPDGDQGYPGALTTTVTYRLAGAALTISVIAEADRPTVVNVTNHSYWNLSGRRDPIADHVVRVAGDRYVPVDGEQIPVGRIDDVAGTRFDLRRPTQLGSVMGDEGIDHCFVLGSGDRAHGLRVAAELRHPPSGRHLVVATDQPGVQLYTANNLPEPRTAVCLEPQCLPDTPNRAVFGSAVVRPGDQYRHNMRFELSPTPA